MSLLFSVALSPTPSLYAISSCVSWCRPGVPLASLESRVASFVGHLLKHKTTPTAHVDSENVLTRGNIVTRGFVTLTSGVPTVSRTSRSRFAVGVVPASLGSAVPRSSFASFRKPDPTATPLGAVVGRFANAASLNVSSPLAPVPDSALREVFRAALVADGGAGGGGETRAGGFGRAAAGGGSGGGRTGKIPAAARASVKQLFRLLVRSGLLQLPQYGPTNVREGKGQEERSEQQQQQSSVEFRFQEKSALRHPGTEDRQIGQPRESATAWRRREPRRQISFNFLTEVYNEAGLYARWGAGAQLVKSAGVKGLRPPGANLRGSIADPSPKPVNYEEFREFVEIVRLRLGEEEYGLLPFCRVAQNS